MDISILRNGQNLPLGPVDRRQAYRRHFRRRLGVIKGKWPVGIALVGLLLAGVGIWLSSLSPSFEVSQDASVYTVRGRGRLLAQSDGSYVGAGGVLLVKTSPWGREAVGSTTINGQSSVGHCWWQYGGTVASCSFRWGSRRFKAVDQRTSSGWRRRYDNGQEVIFTLRRGQPGVLVPFALGVR